MLTTCKSIVARNMKCEMDHVNQLRSEESKTVLSIYQGRESTSLSQACGVHAVLWIHNWCEY